MSEVAPNLLLFPMPEPTPQTDPAMAIYKEYPRKVARPMALQAIRKALRHYPLDTILAATKEFAKLWEGADDYQYCPHPSTWFNQERFADDPSSWSRPHGLKIDRPQKQVVPDWRIQQLLEEELKELDNELMYDFDRKQKPAKVERQRLVKAQLHALKEKLRGKS